jgi:hypothetical protein
MDACEVVTSQEPGDPLAADVVAGLGEGRRGHGYAVCPAAPDVRAPDLRGQFRLRALSCGGTA